MKLHIDIETYSSVDIKTCGLYQYVDSPDFEIMLVAYKFGLLNGEVRVLDLRTDDGREEFQGYLKPALLNPRNTKVAHNASFERNAFRAIGIDIPVEQWECTMVKAAYCGLPLSLDQVSKALDLGDEAKSSVGKALIKYFCTPCKPSKVNEGRTRNLPHHNPEKWENFKKYCAQDVVAEMAIDRILSKYEIPQFEKENYYLDQKINDLGIEIDLQFAKNAIEIDEKNNVILIDKLKNITGVENPNSDSQLKVWLSEQIGEEITTLIKEEIPNILAKTDNPQVHEVLKLRAESSKTSIKKYKAMVASYGMDGRSHGLFQFYGAFRSGRWAGRLIQLQNLPQNHIPDLGVARQLVANNDLEGIEWLYGDVSSILSQLIRTAFVAKKGCTFAVADFSAIEARVIAWLASEKWRLDVFNTHGKIYEASASMMFSVPIEQVTKGSDLRQKGKVAELALGYQGGVGALKTMGGERMGLSESEMQTIVTKWRKANTAIVQMWSDLENEAKKAVRLRREIVSKYRGIKFNCDGFVMSIELPSGRKLMYQSPRLVEGKFGNEAIQYKGMEQTKNIWGWLDTYGGKLTENIVQAIARDLLAHAMQSVEHFGYSVCTHVHDEIVCEVKEFESEKGLRRICTIMSEVPTWANELPQRADGYLTKYYRKD